MDKDKGRTFALRLDKCSSPPGLDEKVIHYQITPTNQPYFTSTVGKSHHCCLCVLLLGFFLPVSVAGCRALIMGDLVTVRRPIVVVPPTYDAYPLSNALWSQSYLGSALAIRLTTNFTLVLNP